MAEYRYEEYYDGSWVPVCLTQASNVWNIAFFVMTISAFFLLPLFILIVLYTIIAKNLISNDGPGRMPKIRPSKPELSFKARKQVVLMLGAVVLSFFICLIPFRIFTLWIIIASDENVKRFGVEKYYNCLYFSRIMLYLNSAINPILYNLMSSKFRKGFRKLWCGSWVRLLSKCHRSERGQLPASQTTTTTTTTTTSITSQGKRLSYSRTMSQDDSRNTNNVANQNESTVAHRCNSSIDSADEFRRLALKGTRYKRQRSSQSITTSGDEEHSDANGIFCVSCTRASAGQSARKSLNGCDAATNCCDKNGLTATHARKKRLKFQRGFDEDQIVHLNDVTTEMDAQPLPEATEDNDDNETDIELEHIVPFIT